MQFQTVEFILFVVVVVTLHWCLPHRARNALLAAASFVFYGWVHPWFVALLLASALTDYAASAGMIAAPARRRPLLALSLAVNLGILAVFKYLDFFVVNVADALAAVGIHNTLEPLHLLMPVGVSFYTFQTMSFSIDVYRGQLKRLPTLVDYLLFIAFFPQLVAGPIERAERLLSQLSAERRFRAAELRDGLFLMAWGFFQKLVIADNVAVTAEKVFALAHPTFPILWAGVFAFSIQIYADFSAYSDIARGSARLVGVTLMRNFDHPYLSRSPPEFWRRWHISLSTWFRDYVYVPLGGGRGSTWSWARNIVVVFALSGLWHGASWNFLAWGLYWAALLLAHRAIVAVVPAGLRAARIVAPLSVALMFVLANVGWLLFRETEGRALVRALLLSPADAPATHVQAAAFLSVQTALYALPLAAHALIATRWPATLTSSSTPALALRAGVVVVLLVGIAYLRADASAAFIYFQF